MDRVTKASYVPKIRVEPIRARRYERAYQAARKRSEAAGKALSKAEWVRMALDVYCDLNK